MCNNSVHCLKVVVGGQRSLFENQWAEPIKRSLYLKGSFPKALSSFSAEIYVRKMPAGQRWTFASMWNIFRGSFENVTPGFKHFVLEISVIFLKEDLLVCLILYFVIENFPDCFPCTSHHLPLGARQGNLRWNCNYSQILIQETGSTHKYKYQKHRKNCECCPGHYLIVNHYFSMSWFIFAICQ